MSDNNGSHIDCRAIITAMQSAIRHRGPDDFGIWQDAEAGIFLGHRRLSILDLSQSGHQPKSSKTGRFTIAFNGEIYNHLDMRAMLENGHGWSGWEGHSDTETLLAAIEIWGLFATLQKARGMFAIALWDRQNRTLSLARDAVGEKPLYYGWQGTGQARTFLFASELKAIAQHPACERNVDRDALTAYLRYNYVPAPQSIWQGVCKLTPGTIHTVSLRNPLGSNEIFWSFVDHAKHGVQNRFAGTPVDAVDALDSVLRAAIQRQMISDVPLGAFLSGGVDSSTIVALMQDISGKPVKTFTIGFDDTAYDESMHARAVADHLGSDHHEMFVSAKDARDVIPNLPQIYCEPFSDSSQIPTFLVSKVARQHVTVALSGDAGDELFAGYNRYAATAGHWNKISRLPRFARKTAGAILQNISPGQWDRLGGRLAKRHFRTFGDKVHKIANAMQADDIIALHRRLASAENEPESWVLGGREQLDVFTNVNTDIAAMDSIDQMMALDTISYLPDDILAKVDRAAMANSLETRVPFLDPDVIDFAWSLPSSHKICNGQTKWPLRQLLYRHVPQSLIDRPKMGFGIPVADWLRGSLRDWAEDLLDEKRLRETGYWNADLVRNAWDIHVSGQQNLSGKLWSVLMFEAWLRQSV